MAEAGLDESMLRQFLSDVGSAAPELIALFEAETHVRILRMDRLATTGDLATLGREAHSLKSAALTYGLNRFADIARDLERSCRDGDIEAVAGLSAQIPGAAATGLETLKAYIRDMS